MTITPRSAARRLVSISAAGLAAVGLLALSAPAHAAPAASQVWVCKYVGTPGVDVRLLGKRDAVGRVGLEGLVAERKFGAGPGYRVAPVPDFYAEVKALLGEAAVL